MPLSDGSVVVAQGAAEALAAIHGTPAVADLGARVDQAIAQTLVVALPVIMLQELANCSA